MSLSRNPAFLAAISTVWFASLCSWTGMRASGGGLSSEQLEILQHMSLVKLPDGNGGMHLTLRIDDLNVQIVNGAGQTESANGRGNLILGYAESQPDELRTGSHNLVLGTRNQHSSYAGIVAGSTNSILAPYATITGGELNRVAGPFSTVSGGFGNRGTGYYTAILGGSDSTAAGNLSTVYGGNQCWAEAGSSVVAGCSQTTLAPCEVLP